MGFISLGGGLSPPPSPCLATRPTPLVRKQFVHFTELFLATAFKTTQWRQATDAMLAIIDSSCTFGTFLRLRLII